MRPITLLAFLVIASPVLAGHSPVLAEQGEASTWRPIEGMNTADLAATGWHQVSAAAVSNSSGVIFLTTFWEGELEGVRVTAQCFTRYREHGLVSFDRCDRPDTSRADMGPVVEAPATIEEEGFQTTPEVVTSEDAPAVVSRPFSRQDLREGRLTQVITEEEAPTETVTE